MAPDEETGEWRPLVDLGQIARCPDPRTMTGTDLYREYYHLDRITPYPHGEQLREYTRLATDPFRTDREDRRLRDLEARLARADVQNLPHRCERRK